jgi:hypothetical protein
MATPEALWRARRAERPRPAARTDTLEHTSDTAKAFEVLWVVAVQARPNSGTLHYSSLPTLDHPQRHHGRRRSVGGCYGLAMHRLPRRYPTAGA